MAEIVEPGVLAATPKKRRKVKFTDILTFAVLVIIIVLLAVTITSRLKLKHDVSAARPVADKVVADIQNRNGSAARALGDKQFQVKNSAANLTALFVKVEEATLKPPTLDRQTVFHGSNGETVFFIYKYSALKVPFYIRIGVAPESGSWKLTSISGTADESSLIVQ